MGDLDLEGDKRLVDRVSLVFGSCGAIGSAVSKRFSKEGAKVILVDRDIEKLKCLDDQIRGVGGSATLVELDALLIEGVQELAGSISSKFGCLDVLVSCVGMLGDLCPIQDYKKEMWQRVMDTNFMLHWYMLKYFDPLLKKSSSGRVIFITSHVVNSCYPYPYWGAYAASKSALEAMTKVYAIENRHTKVCANLICPGKVNSTVYKKAFPGLENDDLPNPEDLTEAFVALASSANKETGKVVDVGVGPGEST